jgi:DNA-binding response OmpR family regulator
MSTVLIVEDEPNLRLLYELELRREGFEVATAASAEEGLSRVDETHPDLVVLDVLLPGRDGIETLQLLRTHQRSLHILLNTACGWSRENYLSWAADEILIKSSDTTELIEAVKRLTMPAARGRATGTTRGDEHAGNTPSPRTRPPAGRTAGLASRHHRRRPRDPDVDGGLVRRRALPAAGSRRRRDRR